MRSTLARANIWRSPDFSPSSVGIHNVALRGWNSFLAGYFSIQLTGYCILEHLWKLKVREEIYFASPCIGFFMDHLETFIAMFLFRAFLANNCDIIRAFFSTYWGQLCWTYRANNKKLLLDVDRENKSLWGMCNEFLQMGQSWYASEINTSKQLSNTNVYNQATMPWLKERE